LAGESIVQGGKITLRALRHVYDYMGMTLFLSAAWFLAGLIPAWFLYTVKVELSSILTDAVFIVLASLVLGPTSAATYQMASWMVRGEYVLVRDYFRAYRRHFKRAVGLAAVLLLILEIISFYLRFFLFGPIPWLQYFAVMWVYFLIAWALMSQYASAALVRRERTVWQTLKVAALLALDNIVASLVVLLAGGVLVVLSVWLAVLLVLFLGGTLAFLHCTAYEVLVAKYGGSDGPMGESERETIDG